MQKKLSVAEQDELDLDGEPERVSTKEDLQEKIKRRTKQLNVSMN